MDPRIALPKPHRDFRQANRRSQRRFIPRTAEQTHLTRYVPPPHSRQPIVSRIGNSTVTSTGDHHRTELTDSLHGKEKISGSNEFYNPHISPSPPVRSTTKPHFDLSYRVSVNLDYVPDRGRMLWSRWVLILLCFAQLISAFAVIICHALDFSEDTKLEVAVSIGILTFGNIFGTTFILPLATGIVTVVLFYRRWRQTGTRSRSKVTEENHEAWICTRAACSLVGMAPIARYVELLVVYRRLSHMEEQWGKASEVPPTGANFQYRNCTSEFTGFPRPDSTKAANEIEKLHRLRCHFVQLDFDACVVALANASLGAGPFAISQGLLYLRRLMLNRMMPTSTSGAVLAAFIFSFLWLTSAACQFQPDAHYLPASELVHLPAHRHQHLVSAGGRIVLFFARAVHISIRLITITFFTGMFKALLGVVMALHAAFYFLLLLIYRGSEGTLTSMYKTNPEYRKPLDQRVKSKGILRHIGTDLLYAYVSIFDFFNGSAGKTRLRAILYYFAYYLENSAMIGAWYTVYPFTASWYYLPVLLVVVTVQWIGAIFLQVYFFYFSSSPRGTSLCGLCCPDELRSHVEIVHTPAPSYNPSMQPVHHLPRPTENPSFIIPTKSFYSRRSLDSKPTELEPSGCSGTDSLTVITTEPPRKPRSRYLYVRDAVEDGSMVEYNLWEDGGGTFLGKASDV